MGVYGVCRKNSIKVIEWKYDDFEIIPVKDAQILTIVAMNDFADGIDNTMLSPKLIDI